MTERRKGSKLQRLTVLAGLAALGAWITYLALFGTENPAALLLTHPPADRMDLYVTQPRGKKFNADGRLTETFEAERMTHFLNSNRSELTAPHFHIFTRDAAVWNGTSARATLLGDTEVQLRDHVVIADQANTTRLTTEQLNYYPKQQKVDSAVAVTIRRENDITNAVGMRADLNTRRVDLLSHVESTNVAP